MEILKHLYWFFTFGSFLWALAMARRSRSQYDADILIIDEPTDSTTLKRRALKVGSGMFTVVLGAGLISGQWPLYVLCLLVLASAGVAKGYYLMRLRTVLMAVALLFALVNRYQLHMDLAAMLGLK